MVQKEALKYITTDVPWEIEPLHNITAEDQLVAYRHNDFWQCMDAYR